MLRTQEIWNSCLETASLTDIGLRRTNNQDSHAMVLAGSQRHWHRRGHLFTLADGMGAHASGELASKMATDLIPMTYYKKEHLPPPVALRQAITEANRAIHARGGVDKDERGMGTTSDTLILLPEGVLIGHVGDSRIYRLRGQRLELMTSDHSLVWELEAKGDLHQAQQKGPVPKNVITRCLGVNAHVKPDLEGPIPVLPGDTFLMCSDGLTGPVNDDEIGKILNVLSPSEAVRALVDLALLRGGPDNVTVQIIKYLGPQLAQGEPSESLCEHTIMPQRQVSPAIWGVLCVCIILSIIFLMLGQHGGIYYILSAISLLGSLSVGYLAYVQHQPLDSFRGVLGHAPYRAFSAVPDERFAKVLVTILKELYASALQSDPDLDLRSWQKLEARGQHELDKKCYPQAVGSFLHAIMGLMAVLRGEK